MIMAKVGSDEWYKSLGYTKKEISYVIVYTNMTQSRHFATKKEAEAYAFTQKHVWTIERREVWK